MGAFSSNHFQEAQDMIGSIQSNLPHTLIIIYNLGLNVSEKTRLTTYCNVQVRTFNFSKYPPYVKHLKKFAWKPIVISEVSKEYEVILYGDTSMRIKHPIAEKFMPLLLKFPYISGPPDGDPITIYTHDSAFKYLRFDMSREVAVKNLHFTLQTVCLV